MAKINFKDANEILAQAEKMGFDDLTDEGFPMNGSMMHGNR